MAKKNLLTITEGIVLVCLGLLTLSYLYWGFKGLSDRLDKQVEVTCHIYAEINKDNYKGTKWENLDFYKSCVENNRCTSPLIPCE